MSRRALLGMGVAGAAGLAGAASLWDWFARWRDAETPADVFKGGAPGEEMWLLWKARGWVKEGRHYVKLGRNVQCKVCPNNCLLAPGDRGHCRNRINRDGTLYTLAYGNPCTFHVDPVEKKPLYHFLPGTRTFSLATAGCVFRCLNCQNWEISQRKPEDTKNPRGPEFRFRPPLPASLTHEQMERLSLFPEDAAAVAAALGCPTISYTYSEPTAFYEYTQDTCKAARAHHLRNIVVSCGSIEERAARDLYAWVDAAHVDLKGFDEAVYQKLNSGRLAPVLRTLKLLRDLGVWFEIINLIVPTYTDPPDMIRRMCAWIAKELGPDRPLHFSRFHPQYKLSHLPPTPIATLVRARDLARAEGLRHVYIGNAPGLEDAGITRCPNCRKAVVRRDIYAVTHLDIVQGKCRFCGAPIPGVWT
ncbi:MAG: AmmeMemoRadiSam system radical SAM enzyme [Verrucomicrobia bacterium]|nr:AmmeMemoRadiSam system radical SAM enzyme [Verrucomicrobiota bacterium]